MRALTDEQIAKKEQQQIKQESTIRTCSAIKGDSDYKYVGLCLVHRRELQNKIYRECGKFFEILYLGEWRSAFKKDFIIDNQ